MGWDDRSPVKGKGRRRRTPAPLIPLSRQGPLFARMIGLPRAANDNQAPDNAHLIPRLIIHSMIVLTLIVLASSKLLELI